MTPREMRLAVYEECVALCEQAYARYGSICATGSQFVKRELTDAIMRLRTERPSVPTALDFAEEPYL